MRRSSASSTGSRTLVSEVCRVYRGVLFRPTAVRSRAAQLAAAPPLAARLDLPRDLRRLGLAWRSRTCSLSARSSSNVVCLSREVAPGSGSPMLEGAIAQRRASRLAVTSDVVPHGAVLPKAFSSMVTCFRAMVPICSAKYVTGRSGCSGPEFVGAYLAAGLENALLVHRAALPRLRVPIVRHTDL